MRTRHPEITTAGTPVLHRPAAPVTDFGPGLARLFARLERVCREASGAGLAAPQVGVALAAAIVFTDEMPFPIDLVNPRIVGAGGVQSGPEGCLSVDGSFDGNTTRPEVVLVEAADRHGIVRQFEAHGFIARACCHEIDHLGGIVFTDRRPSPLEGIVAGRPRR
jgi:peptide deformylase